MLFYSDVFSFVYINVGRAEKTEPLCNAIQFIHTTNYILKVEFISSK